MKHCNKCKTHKEKKEFGKHRLRYDGVQVYCKPCSKKIARDWYLKNKEKAKNQSKEYWRKTRRNRKLVSTYGITEDDYKDMYTTQDGRCKICRDKKPMLNVDHCHKTDKVRGLLCTKCNLGIGYFNDDIKIVKKIIKYLEEHNG